MSPYEDYSRVKEIGCPQRTIPEILEQFSRIAVNLTMTFVTLQLAHVITSIFLHLLLRNSIFPVLKKPPQSESSEPNSKKPLKRQECPKGSAQHDSTDQTSCQRRSQNDRSDSLGLAANRGLSGHTYPTSLSFKQSSCILFPSEMLDVFTESIV